MQTFLKNIITFIAGLLLINFLMYFFLFKPAIFDKYIFNKNSIKEYNLFLLSDSHGAYIAEIPSENRIFNFSNTAENYLDMYLKINYLTSFLTEKDTILLAIDNHNLSSYRSGFGRINENILYVDDFSGIEPAAIESNFYFKPITKFIPLLDPTYNRSILKYLYHQFTESKNVTSYSRLSSKGKEAASKKRYNLQFDNKSVSTQQTDYLEKIIELCEKKKITLIGLKFPISLDYWKIMGENDFGIKELWLSHNLKIIDLHDMFFANDEYFYDQDHLNVKGGKLFCKEIQKKLKDI